MKRLNDYIINTTIEFLEKYPDLYEPIPKKSSRDTSTAEVKNIIRARLEKKLNAKVIPSTPKTIPDPMVSLILEKFYNKKKENLKVIEKEHQLSMAAENKVGEYLELYICYKAYKTKSWVHCLGNIVKGIDFIKKIDADNWKLLQIKNRSNTENSSSNKIRELLKTRYGIDVIKWHRVDAITGKTNWDIFPDDEFKKELNEKDFNKFIAKYVNFIKRDLSLD